MMEIASGCTIRVKSTEDRQVPDDKMDQITKQGREVIDKVTNAVEKTGKQVVKSVSQLTGGQLEDVTEEVIQESVDKALDILKVAGDQVREKGMESERVSLRVSINIGGVAELTVANDVPENQVEGPMDGAIDKI